MLMQANIWVGLTFRFKTTMVQMLPCHIKYSLFFLERNLMTTSFDPGQAGWQVIDASVFAKLIGPVWRRKSKEEMLYGLVVTDRQSDQNGFADGGALGTLLDCAL
jgi:hypothetical protein